MPSWQVFALAVGAALAGWIVRAIVGQEVSRLWQAFRGRLEGWAGRRRAQLLTVKLSGNELEPRARRIVQHYASRGRLKALYRTQPPGKHVLPALQDTSPRFVGRLRLDDDFPLRFERAEMVRHPYDVQLVERLRAQKRRLTDDPALYVVRQHPDAAELGVGVTNYLGSLALSTALSASTTPEGGVANPMLDGAFKSFAHAISDPLPGPMLLGLDVCTVFRDEQGLEYTPLHQRSAETVNAHGRWAVVPACTVVPNRNGPMRSRFGVIPYNVLKEILEELFGLVDISTAESAPRGAHPDWVFDNLEGERLLGEVDGGRVKLSLTGAMVDLTHGSLVLCVVADFESAEFAAWAMLKSKGSWEAQQTPDSNNLIVPKLLDDQLLLRRSPQEFKLSSVVALDSMFRVRNVG